MKDMKVSDQHPLYTIAILLSKMVPEGLGLANLSSIPKIHHCFICTLDRGYFEPVDPGDMRSNICNSNDGYELFDTIVEME